MLAPTWTEKFTRSDMAWDTARLAMASDWCPRRNGVAQVKVSSTTGASARPCVRPLVSGLILHTFGTARNTPLFHVVPTPMEFMVGTMFFHYAFHIK